MPIEINELVIKASISAAESPKQAAVALTDNQQKIQQLMDEVLKKLNSRDER